jgi:tRNA threonylcarbamoyladenosine biosynthesis protein TsaE
LIIWILTEGFLIEWISVSPEETFGLGRQIAGSLAAGSVVALRGGLGSGKTCLVKGIASGLGIDETITSPTYTIINEYANLPALYHIDAYRLEDEDDFNEIGGRELICGNGISLVEWRKKKKKSLPRNTITISLEITGPLSRLIRIHGLELP